jgi:hypothetical protein
MEFAVSFVVIGKALLFAVASLFVALVVLSPINDQNPGKVQFTVFAIVEALMFAFTFGFFSVKLVA